MPVTHWSAGLLAVHLQSLELDFSISESSVRRILQDADLQPHRQQMWLTSQDEESRAKRDDVLHVYYDTPPEEHIICVDEICDNLFAHDTDDAQDWFDDTPHAHAHEPRPTPDPHAHAHAPDGGASGAFPQDKLDAYRIACELAALANRVCGSGCRRGSAARHGDRAAARRSEAQGPRKPRVGHVDGLD